MTATQKNMSDAFADNIIVDGPVTTFIHACRANDKYSMDMICRYHLPTSCASSLVTMVIAAAKIGYVKGIRRIVKAMNRRGMMDALSARIAIIYDIACSLPRRAPFNERSIYDNHGNKAGYMDVFYAAYPRKLRNHLIQKIPPTYPRLVNAINNRIAPIALMMMSQLPILSDDAVEYERAIVRYLQHSSDIIAHSLVDRIIFEAKNNEMMAGDFQISLRRYWAINNGAAIRLFHELPVPIAVMAHIMVEYSSTIGHSSEWIKHFVHSTNEADMARFISAYFIRLYISPDITHIFISEVAELYDLRELAGGILVTSYEHHNEKTMTVLMRMGIDPSTVRLSENSVRNMKYSGVTRFVRYVTRAIHASGMIDVLMGTIYDIRDYSICIVVDELLRLRDSREERDSAFLVKIRERLPRAFSYSVKRKQCYLFIDRAVSIGFWDKSLNPMDYITYMNDDHGNPRVAAIISRRKVVDRPRVFSDVTIVTP